MIIPKEMKIGGYIITIGYDNSLLLERNNYGEYKPKSQEIILQSDMTKQQELETFLHEILEAITSIYYIKLEHEHLSLIATVVHQIIKDNYEDKNE